MRLGNFGGSHSVGGGGGGGTLVGDVTGPIGSNIVAHITGVAGNVSIGTGGVDTHFVLPANGSGAAGDAYWDGGLAGNGGGTSFVYTPGASSNGDAGGFYVNPVDGVSAGSNGSNIFMTAGGAGPGGLAGQIGIQNESNQGFTVDPSGNTALSGLSVTLADAIGSQLLLDGTGNVTLQGGASGTTTVSGYALNLTSSAGGLFLTSPNQIVGASGTTGLAGSVTWQAYDATPTLTASLVLDGAAGAATLSGNDITINGAVITETATAMNVTIGPYGGGSATGMYTLIADHDITLTSTNRSITLTDGGGDSLSMDGGGNATLTADGVLTLAAASGGSSITVASGIELFSGTGSTVTMADDGTVNMHASGGISVSAYGGSSVINTFTEGPSITELDFGSYGFTAVRMISGGSVNLTDNASSALNLDGTGNASLVGSNNILYTTQVWGGNIDIAASASGGTAYFTGDNVYISSNAGDLVMGFGAGWQLNNVPTSSTASTTLGGATLPALAHHYLVYKDGANTYKIPCYAA